MCIPAFHLRGYPSAAEVATIAPSAALGGREACFRAACFATPLVLPTAQQSCDGCPPGSTEGGLGTGNAERNDKGGRGGGGGKDAGELGELVRSRRGPTTGGLGNDDHAQFLYSRFPAGATCFHRCVPTRPRRGTCHGRGLMDTVSRGTRPIF